MNAVVDFDGTPDLCRYHPLSYWLQHALKSEDLRGARALYSTPFRKSSARSARVSASRVSGSAAAHPAWAGSDLPLLGDNELAAALTG